MGVCGFELSASGPRTVGDCGVERDGDVVLELGREYRPEGTSGGTGGSGRRCRSPWLWLANRGETNCCCGGSMGA
jgi:hypothetical protein